MKLATFEINYLIQVAKMTEISADEYHVFVCRVGPTRVWCVFVVVMLTCAV